MGALSIQTLVRTFAFNGMSLADPGPGMAPDAVKEFYANLYPELTNAAIEGPEQKGDKLVYEFRRAVGTKGAELRERLEAHISGECGKPRGNALDLATLERVQPFARACRGLTFSPHHVGAPERVAAPSEALPFLP
jgi:PRTRC genetic system protein C